VRVTGHGQAQQIVEGETSAPDVQQPGTRLPAQH
jgi:hypothetical protein